MKNLLNTVLCSLALGILAAPMAFAQAKQESRLFGGWELTKFTITSKNGNTTPFCDGVFGKLIYEKSGSVSVGINCGPHISKDAPALQYGGMLFYSGNFSIQGNSVLHRIENSNVAALLGKEVSRKVEILTDTSLVLTGTLGSGGQLRIEWKRAVVTEDLDPKNEIALLTYLKLKPGSEEQFLNRFEKIIQPSLSEPGNIAWFVQQADEDPTNIVFYTRWINEDALHQHLKSAPLADYISKTAALLEPGYPQLIRFHPIDLAN